MVESEYRADMSFPSLETHAVQRNQNPSLKVCLSVGIKVFKLIEWLTRESLFFSSEQVLSAKIFRGMEHEKDEKYGRETLLDPRTYETRDSEQIDGDKAGAYDSSRSESEDDDCEENDATKKTHTYQRRFSDFCLVCLSFTIHISSSPPSPISSHLSNRSASASTSSFNSFILHRLDQEMNAG
jgi:hypothetical protein